MSSISLTGRRILGYTVKEKLGSGTYGTVYKVEKVNAAGHFVRALKHIAFPNQRQYNSLLNSMGGDVEKVNLYFSRMQKNILSEVQILNNLSESGVPHVVRYYESDIQTRGNPKHYDIFILMEYLTALDDFLLENTMTVRDVIRVGEDILEGLAACHASDVIHRDIKTENIFVYTNRMTGEREYKIGDFGIAREMRGSSRAESAKGTPDFLAPEVFSGKKGYTKSVDLYSLGIVLYRMLNYSRGPFLPRYPEQYFGDDEEDAFQRRMDGEIPDMPSAGGKALGYVIVRAISGEKERFSSAEEFLGALRRAAREMDAETLGRKIQIQGTGHRSQTEREKTISDFMTDEFDRPQTSVVDGGQGLFRPDPVVDLSLYGTLRCRDYELEKNRERQVSTPEGMISVQLPRDVRDGQKIPYLEKGRTDPYTGKRGILYVTVQIEQTTFLQRYRKYLIAGGCAAAVLLVVLVIGIFAMKKTPEPILVPQTAATNPTQLMPTVPPQSVATEPYQPTEPVATTFQKVSPVYLNEFPVFSSYGKIWVRGSREPDCPYDTNSAPHWEDEDCMGYTPGTARDNDGHRYEYGLHVDGDTKGPFFVSFDLDGHYQKLTGYCAYPHPDSIISTKYGTAYSKCVEIYGDDELLFTSVDMNCQKSRQRISLDISGVDVLRIEYPATMGPNEIATLFDMLIE